ncbi:hypothetical protein BDV40DRAFT_260720 [Aspergillus tamarii]|uniref:Uncharacterized protein n=1 Tax=Aspergillus tamarii TaxID=41984 RepID=A0A5N6V025_ASPTM|nr:hypothetical protein BDV40DRAFT_260720 [Aspergillus tamarii]
MGCYYCIHYSILVRTVSRAWLILTGVESVAGSGLGTPINYPAILVPCRGQPLLPCQAHISTVEVVSQFAIMVLASGYCLQASDCR